MKQAKALRRDARTALRGKWGSAVGASLVAVLLGGCDIVQSNVLSLGGRFVAEPVQRLLLQLSPDIGSADFFDKQTSLLQSQIFTLVFMLLSFLAGMALLIHFFVGSAMEVGYSRYNLRLIDGESPRVGTLFSGFEQYNAAIGSLILRAIYISLWSLLLFIPGVMKSYSYAMTSFVLAENPGMTANRAITRSKELMKGNRWKLFCLELSFIGWSLLTVLSCGIGLLWLKPYQNAARAAFYRTLTGRKIEFTPGGAAVAAESAADVGEEASLTEAVPAVVEEAAEASQSAE